MSDYATRADFEDAVQRGERPRYRPCSGQSRGPRHWSVGDELIPWWRPEDARGRTRLFSSFEAAKVLADKLNAERRP